MTTPEPDMDLLAVLDEPRCDDCGGAVYECDCPTPSGALGAVKAAYARGRASVVDQLRAIAADEERYNARFHRDSPRGAAGQARVGMLREAIARIESTPTDGSKPHEH